MHFIWTLLNSNLGVAFIGATLLESIRRGHQWATETAARKIERQKHVQIEQSKLFNELSILTTSIVANVQLLLNVLLDNLQHSEQYEMTELNEREAKLLDSIMRWEQAHLSIRYRIQQLTSTQAGHDSLAMRIFSGDSRTEVAQTLVNKITDDITLSASIAILCSKILQYIGFFRQKARMAQQNTTGHPSPGNFSYSLSANVATSAAMPLKQSFHEPEPPTFAELAEEDKVEKLAVCRQKLTQLISSTEKMQHWLLNDATQPDNVLCDASSRYLLEQTDPTHYIILLRLEMQRDMLRLTEQVENKINHFFKVLDKDFQDYLKSDN